MRIQTTLRRGLLLTILLMLATFVAGLSLLLHQNTLKQGPSIPPNTHNTSTLELTTPPTKTPTARLPISVPKRTQNAISNTPAYTLTPVKHTLEESLSPTPKQPPSPPNTQYEANNSPKIAIILDDIGHQWAAGKRSVNLKGEVTLAILPFSPYAQQLATLATASNKEVMLHAPMEPISHHSWDGGLSNDMSREQLKNTLQQMIAAVPGAAGVNNHMGSALTQNSTIMSWVMETLAEQNMYFIDSRTSALSRAQSTAQSHSIPNQKRDVFLDNTREITAIEKQVSKLIQLATKNGVAIGIGHPYPETLTVLEQSMNMFTHQNIQLVPVSELLLNGAPNLPAKAPSNDMDSPINAAISASNNAHF